MKHLPPDVPLEQRGTLISATLSLQKVDSERAFETIAWRAVSEMRSESTSGEETQQSYTDLRKKRRLPCDAFGNSLSCSFYFC
jgi:hypothetical protein